MADVDRIAPPIPTLPPPVGRNVGRGGASGRRSSRRRSARRPDADNPHATTPPEHIDEYV